jgi:hypothetical protein
VINDVSTSFSGLSLIGRAFFFADVVGEGSPPSNGLGLEDFFFAFSSLRAFNDGKTRVKPEDVAVAPRRLTEESASFIPATSVTAPSVHSSFKKKRRRKANG